MVKRTVVGKRLRFFFTMFSTSAMWAVGRIQAEALEFWGFDGGKTENMGKLSRGSSTAKESSYFLFFPVLPGTEGDEFGAEGIRLKKDNGAATPVLGLPHECGRIWVHKLAVEVALCWTVCIQDFRFAFCFRFIRICIWKWGARGNLEALSSRQPLSVWTARGWEETRRPWGWLIVKITAAWANWQHLVKQIVGNPKAQSSGA